jgi:hypothetical protein
VDTLDITDLLRDLGLNLVALGVLVIAVYYRRHRRWEQVIGYVAFNVSLFTVAAALASSGPINIGVGFGLFAVLSIVRLRSDESTQSEIGYTMVALVLGLMTGLPGMAFEVKVVFSVLLVGTMAVIDMAALQKVGSHTRMRLTMDHVITDKADLETAVVSRLGGPVREIQIREVNLVRDTMELEVLMARSRRP